MTHDPTSPPGGGHTTEGDDTTIIQIPLPDWVGDLRPLADEVGRILFITRNPLIWIVAVFLGVPVTSATITALRNGEGPLWEQVVVPLAQKGPVAVILDDFFYRTVLVPFAGFLFDTAASIVFGVLGLFGIPEAVIRGGFQSAAAGIGSAASGVVAAVVTFNRSLVEPVTALGIGAQPAATAIGVLEIFGAAWVVWIVVNSLDFPLINPLGFVRSLTRPIRNLLGAFR